MIKLQNHQEQCNQLLELQDFHEKFSKLKSNGKPSLLSQKEFKLEGDSFGEEIRRRSKYAAFNIPEMYQTLLNKHGMLEKDFVVDDLELIQIAKAKMATEKSEEESEEKSEEKFAEKFEAKQSANLIQHEELDLQVCSQLFS